MNETSNGQSVEVKQSTPWVNRVFLGSCEEMSAIPAASVHCVVTSPPYDAVRDYDGYTGFNLNHVISELARVVVVGGVVSWVVQDQTRDFAKTGTSFKTAIAFMDAGWKMLETCIYRKQAPPAGNPLSWRVDHEYIFQFYRGDRPRVLNKWALKIPAKWAGRVRSPGIRQRDGSVKVSIFEVDEFKCRGTVWDYKHEPEKEEHPATFPDALASDLIQAFSNEGDVVLDPFMGSGTTAVMAEVLRRRWTGYEISPTYYELIQRRISQRSLFGESA